MRTCPPKLRAAVSAGAFLLLAGCAPAARYYIQLQPLSNSVDLQAGDSIPASERRKADAAATYFGQHRSAIEIALRIRNLSDSDLAVDPALMSGRVAWTDTSGKHVEMPLRVVERSGAIQLLNRLKAEEANKANPYNSNAVGASGELLDASAGLASSLGAREPSEAKEAREQRQQDAEERRRKEAQFEETRSANMTEMSAEITYQQDRVWGPAILKPGEMQEKSLLLASPPEGDTLILVVPFGMEQHRFVFRQTKVRIK